MGVSLLQVVNWGIVITAEATKETNNQFPFLAALILILIVAVVSIGDMVAVNKSKEEEEKRKDEEHKMDSKM